MARNTFHLLLVLVVILAGTFLGANGRRQTTKLRNFREDEAGNWQMLSNEDEVVQQVAAYGALAVNDLNPYNSQKKHGLFDIRMGRSKAIFEYEVVLTTQQTYCPLDAPAEEECELNPRGNKLRCTVVVDYDPADGSMILQEDELKCSQERKMTGRTFVSGGTWRKVSEERRKRSIDEDQLRRIPKYKLITPVFPYYDEFESFRIKFNRTYEQHSDEYNLRYEIFEENMEQVKLLNHYEQGTAKYGATKFADVSKEEFKQYYLGLKQPVEDHTLRPAKIPAFKAPDAFDWRDKGAVTEVKDQGTCGSSWAFSTTGNFEGQLKIQKGALVSLSEQELVDCDEIDEGCNGGLPTQAYHEIMRLGGLASEEDYAYKGYGEKCEFDKSKTKVNIGGAVNISKDEGEMASWLAANGPISIGINANAMQFYFGGISYPSSFLCNPDSIDHGVLIVGYGGEGDKPYWIIKNSWGADWGQMGYYLVYRGAGVCGLNQMCTSAVVHQEQVHRHQRDRLYI